MTSVSEFTILKTPFFAPFHISHISHIPQYTPNDKYTTHDQYTKKILKLDKLKLSDIVYIYNDGNNHKIVPFNIKDKHPIIYDKYYENGMVYDISITLCPYTACAAIYFGHFSLSNELYNNNIVLINNDNNTRLIQLTGETFKNNNSPMIDELFRRAEVKIMIVRDILIRYPDSLLLTTNDQDSQYNPDHPANPDRIYKINNTDYNPKISKQFGYDPLTVVFGIEYMSKTTKYKYSVIIPHKNNINSFTIYYDKMMTKIKKKAGIIIPCYFFAWINFYPNSRIVKL
jgi:hypothetical protein